MFAHLAAVAADADDVAVVQQAVDERRGHALVAKLGGSHLPNHRRAAALLVAPFLGLDRTALLKDEDMVLKRRLDRLKPHRDVASSPGTVQAWNTCKRTGRFGVRPLKSLGSNSVRQRRGDLGALSDEATRLLILVDALHTPKGGLLMNCFGSPVGAR